MAPRTEFEEYFTSGLALARSAARRVLGTSDDIDDIAAETLARLLVRWPILGRAAHRDRWVTRVATNLAIDSLRKKARRAKIEPRARQTPAADLDGRVLDALTLRRLPRRQRETVALRYLGGYSTEEVAAVLDLSVNSVKTHLRRGLHTLRVELDKGDDHGC